MPGTIYAASPWHRRLDDYTAPSEDIRGRLARSAEAIDGADHGLERGGKDALIDANTPADHPIRRPSLDIGRGLGVGPGRHGVLGIVVDVDLEAQILLQAVDKGSDRTVPLAGHRVRPAVDVELHRDLRTIRIGRGLVTQELHRSIGREVGAFKGLPHVVGADLGPGILGNGLNGLGELDLQAAWQNHAVLALHDIRDAALARLAIDAHHGLVGPADVLGIDRQVGDAPHRIILGQRGETLLDGVLMRAGERGIDQIASVWMARMHRQTVAVLGNSTQVIDVTDVELGIDAHGEQVHGDVDDVDIAGALTVAKQRALDPVRPRHDAELRRCHSAAAIVMGVERQDDPLTLADRAEEPLDDVPVHIRGVALDGRRQIEDDLVVLVIGLDDVHHRLADLDGELGLGQCETLWRVFVAHEGARNQLLQLLGELGGTGGDVDDARLVETEHDAALQGIRRVVEVDDGAACAPDAFVRALDQLGAALHQHLDGHILRDKILFDQHAHEVVIGLAGRGKTHLDFLESHLDEDIEHVALALDVHRVDQRLIAVAQVDRAPQRRLFDTAIGPCPVVQHNRDPWLVLLEWHRLRSYRFGRHATYPFPQ